MQKVQLFDALRVQQSYLPAIRAAIERVLISGRYVLGPEVTNFESEFAAWCGASHAVGVANGTDALTLALLALGVETGSRVVTVANAGGYATAAIRACGAMPIYVDIDPDTLLVQPTAIAAALRETPDAVIVTHLYGRLAPIQQIVAACTAASVPVIEDCAQAHGAGAGGQRAGSFGAIGCFSFYPTKNLGALGDGGALVTRDATIAARLRALRQYGWTRKYHSEHAGGRNSRLDEVQAAVLRVKLAGVDADNQRRREIGGRYDRELDNRQLIRLAARGGEGDVVHLYVVRCARRERLREHLAEHGIESEIHYPVLDHCQLAWPVPAPPRLAHSETAAAEVVSLPCHPALTDSEVERVIAAVNSFAS